MVTRVHLDLGQIVATPGALEALDRCDSNVSHYLQRHSTGDWGDLCVEDKQANADALNQDDPQRVLSAYTLSTGVKIWIITEFDRSVTTVLLPEDY